VAAGAELVATTAARSKSSRGFALRHPSRQSPGVGAAPEVGLCQSCEHARCVRSARGSAFWLCAQHDRDPRFAKYPRLPVRACTGYTQQTTTREKPEETP
jgi:hypothetical protein